MIKTDISVIIPVFNSANTIIESITSVISDCCENLYSWELIIVDDGSTDNSLELINKYISDSPVKDKIRLISQINGGAAVARNTGIKLANGEFIAFNDSDDRWLSGKVSMQMNFLKNHTDVDMVGCIFGKDTFQKKSLQRLDYITKINIKHQVYKNFFATQTVIFRRNVLDKTGLFNEKLRYAEEGYFFNRMVYYYNCVLILELVTESINPKYRWGDSGLSGNLLRMELGELFNIRSAYKSKFIPSGHFIFAFLFSIVKFLRRCFISLIRFIC